MIKWICVGIVMIVFLLIGIFILYPIIESMFAPHHTSKVVKFDEIGGTKYENPELLGAKDE